MGCQGLTAFSAGCISGRNRWSGRVDAEKHYITHLWSGAAGSSVDLYRNGKLINSTPNDGRHTTAHRYDGTATWRVKICQAGSTAVCSPERSITLSN
jgi:hypothetical protein